MTHIVWSLVERSFPRVASAVLMLTLAALTSPDLVGIYAWAALALTLVSACSDAALRQIIITLFRNQASLAFLRRYRWTAAVVGTLAMGIVILTLALLNLGRPETIRQALSLLPMALVPAVLAWSVLHIGYLQLRNAWRTLAGTQFWAALGSLVVTLPIVLATGSLLAAALQPLITEFVVALIARSRALRLNEVEFLRNIPDHSIGNNEYWHATVLSILGWFQSQSDRLLVGLIGGTTLLGLFNTGWALGRSGAESLGAAAANVMRSQMRDVESQTPERQREMMSRPLIMCAFAGLGVALVTVSLSVWVIGPILGDEWRMSVDAASVLAVSTPATAVGWSMTSALAGRGRLKWGSPAKLVGIALSILVAFAALQSLEAAAWVVVAREWVVLFLAVIALKLGVPWRPMAVTAAATLVAAVSAFLAVSVT